jgi:Mrp family chromosome partitioning ATPase
MTTFDRAFIKAFTDTPDQASAPERAIAPPHAPARPTRARLGGTPARATELGEPTPRAPIATGSSARPLSSFAPQPKLQDPCRALLEVDRFDWPAPVRDLLAAASREWEAFTEQIVERMGQGKKCLAVASIGRGDGRTTITLALAKQLASRGLRPVVVDADCERPELARACGVSVHTGWDDLVGSELILGESLIAAVDEGVTLMPWRTAIPGGKPLAASLRVSAIFASLRDHYDLILIDAPPLVGKTAIADFAGFASSVHLDGAYLLHNMSQHAREPLSAACTRLRNASVPVAGTIENFVSAARPRPAFPGPSTLPGPLAAARA